jgi:hypothetical protein
MYHRFTIGKNSPNSFGWKVKCQLMSGGGERKSLKAYDGKHETSEGRLSVINGICLSFTYLQTLEWQSLNVKSISRQRHYRRVRDAGGLFSFPSRLGLVREFCHAVTDH